MQFSSTEPGFNPQMYDGTFTAAGCSDKTARSTENSNNATYIDCYTWNFSKDVNPTFKESHFPCEANFDGAKHYRLPVEVAIPIFHQLAENDQAFGQITHASKINIGNNNWELETPPPNTIDAIATLSKNVRESVEAAEKISSTISPEINLFCLITPEGTLLKKGVNKKDLKMDQENHHVNSDSKNFSEHSQIFSKYDSSTLNLNQNRQYFTSAVVSPTSAEYHFDQQSWLFTSPQCGYVREKAREVLKAVMSQDKTSNIKELFTNIGAFKRIEKQEEAIETARRSHIEKLDNEDLQENKEKLTEYLENQPLPTFSMTHDPKGGTLANSRMNSFGTQSKVEVKNTPIIQNAERNYHSSNFPLRRIDGPNSSNSLLDPKMLAAQTRKATNLLRALPK